MSQLQPMPESRGEIVAHRPDMNALMMTALQHGEAGAASLEKLVALQERMEDRQAIREYNASMAALQSECPTIPHSKKGAHGTYTEYDVLCEFLQPFCERHGFSYSFDTEVGDGRQLTTCIVSHVGGAEKRHKFSAQVEKASRTSLSQEDVKAMAYGRRISLTLAFGLRTGKVDASGRPTDDDGDGYQPLTEEQARAISEWLHESSADPEKFLAWVRQAYPAVKTVEEIPAKHYGECVAALKRKKGS